MHTPFTHTYTYLTGTYERERESTRKGITSAINVGVNNSHTNKVNYYTKKRYNIENWDRTKAIVLQNHFSFAHEH